MTATGTSDPPGCRLFLGLCIDSNLPPESCPLHSELSPAAIERAAELRTADSSRCVHRGVTPLRYEPCACPVIAELPIYRCDLLAADCADLRTPAAPALYCGTCPHRTARKP